MLLLDSGMQGVSGGLGFQGERSRPRRYDLW